MVKSHAASEFARNGLGARDVPVFNHRHVPLFILRSKVRRSLQESQ